MLENPCDRDCPRRKPGCGANCPDWQDYVEERNAEYEVRASACRAKGDYLGTSWAAKTHRQKINIWHADNRRKHKRKGS